MSSLSWWGDSTLCCHSGCQVPSALLLCYPMGTVFICMSESIVAYEGEERVSGVGDFLSDMRWVEVDLLVSFGL